MKTLRNAGLVLGLLIVAAFAAPQYTNPSDPYLGTNKLGICYNHAANNWFSIANTTANYNYFANQCDSAGNLIPPANGSVTSVSVTTANGVSGTVATPTTTPAISLTLGVITPTSVNGVAAANAVSSVTPTAGHAACIKSAGPPVVVSFCTSVVASDGTCTCN